VPRGELLLRRLLLPPQLLRQGRVPLLSSSSLFLLLRLPPSFPLSGLAAAARRRLHRRLCFCLSEREKREGGKRNLKNKKRSRFVFEVLKKKSSARAKKTALMTMLWKGNKKTRPNRGCFPQAARHPIGFVEEQAQGSQMV
jgi:hypothetical protein